MGHFPFLLFMISSFIAIIGVISLVRSLLNIDIIGIVLGVLMIVGGMHMLRGMFG